MVVFERRVWVLKEGGALWAVLATFEVGALGSGSGRLSWRRVLFNPGDVASTVAVGRRWGCRLSWLALVEPGDVAVSG